MVELNLKLNTFLLEECLELGHHGVAISDNRLT